MRARTSDGEIVAVTRALASRSGLLTAVAEDVGDAAPVPLPRVTSGQLLLMIRFCERVAASEGALAAADERGDREGRLRLVREHDAWEKAFLEGVQADVPGLMSVAGYMDIERLLQACSINIAEFIKTRDPEEIRDYFKLSKPHHRRPRHLRN